MSVKGAVAVALTLAAERAHLARLVPGRVPRTTCAVAMPSGVGRGGVRGERRPGRGIGEHEDDRRPFDRPARAVRHRGHERLRQRVAHAAVLPVALQQRHGRGLARAGQQQVAPAATGGQQEDGQYRGSADGMLRVSDGWLGVHDVLAGVGECRGCPSHAGSGPRLGGARLG